MSTEAAMASLYPFDPNRERSEEECLAVRRWLAASPPSPSSRAGDIYLLSNWRDARLFMWVAYRVMAQEVLWQDA